MIYIVEDDPALQELETYILQSAGLAAKPLPDGAAFRAACASELPELAILDVMLPGESGLHLLKALRADPLTGALPVMMVTAKGTEMDVVKGLDLGADDYIAKPFGVMEFLSRVRALLRRAGHGSPGPEGVLRAGDVELNDVTHTVRCGGREVALTYKEYTLLRLFLQNPGEALSREYILKEVWNSDVFVESRTLDMHVRSLRQKLGNSGAMLQTVRKVGFKLVAPGPLLNNS